MVGGSVASLRIKRVPRNPLIAGGASTIVFLGIVSFAIFGATNLIDIDPLDFPESPGVPVPIPIGGRGGFLLAIPALRSPCIALLRALQASGSWSAALGDTPGTIAFLGGQRLPFRHKQARPPQLPGTRPVE